MKKITTILTILALFAAAHQARADEVDPTTHLKYTVSSNEVTVTGFDDEFTPPADYALVIPDEIAGMPVVALGENAFKEKTTVASVTIPSTVTSIGASAFEGCNQMVTATFADGINLTTIPSRCFYNCSSLTGITIPASVTTISTSAFYQCLAFTSLTVPSTVRTISDYGFDNCRGLTSVTIESGVTSLGGWSFRNCNQLTVFIIPSTVTTVGEYAFCWCSRLEEVAIPSSVTSLSNNIFYECGALRELNINCQNIPSSLCANKENLTTVVFGSNVKTIGESAFTYTGLTSVVIPKSVTTLGANSFRHCVDLTSFTFENGSKLSWMGGGVFRDSSGLPSITLPSTLTTIDDSFAFQNCTSLTTVSFEAGCRLTSIPSNTFNGCSALTSITIPATVAEMGHDAFSYCTSLASVTFEGSSQLSAIPSSAFAYCSSLAGIDIPSSVTTIGDNAFDNCRSLASLTIPSSVTSIGAYGFRSCVKLTSLTIPSSITTLGSAVFSWCTGVTSVTFEEPCSLTSFPNLIFNDCKSLPSITIPSSVRSIGNQAFRECLAMTEIVIPRNVQTIGTNIVEGCIPLEILDLSACSDAWELYNGPINATTRYEGDTKLDYITIILPPGSNATGTDIQVTNLGSISQDAYGWYLINSAEDFNRFATIARSDPSVNALLEKDIVLTGNELTVGMGYDESHVIAYSGTFDGQGHSITVNFTGPNRIQHQYGGLFSWANGATIQNLWIKGVMETTQKYAGGFVGGINGTLTITKCKSSVSLTGLVDTTTEMRLGGFFGQTHSATVSVSDCLTAASILGGANVTYVGGIGFVANSSTLTMTNCFSMASFDCTSCSMFNWRNSSTLSGTNNLYLADVADADLVAAASAYQTAVSYAQAADGRVAAALDAGGSGGTWVQDPVTNLPSLRLFANAATRALATAVAATVLGESKYVTTFYCGTESYRLPDGAKAYTMELDGAKAVFYQIGDDGRVIPAGNAVVIVSDSASNVLTQLDNASVYPKAGNILRGSDTDIDKPAGTVYVLGVTDSAPGLYIFTGSTIPAGKAYYVSE